MAKKIGRSRRTQKTHMRRGQSAVSAPLPPKLTAPRPANIFIRKRLFELLDRIREDHPVIWISAPAGSGKTSLAASYLTARRAKVLWYQADSGDGDLASFFYYMGIAVKKAAPRYKHPLPLFTPEYLGDVPTFTRNFVREAYRRLPKGMAIVLDNYQDIPEEAALHDILSIVMEEMPSHLTLLVLSRLEPPSVLARLRLCEHAACLDWEKMRLTPDETEGISNLRLGKHRLDADTLNQLHERAAGWTTGVVLMLEQSRDGPLTFSELPKGQQLLFDYFAGEILNCCEPHVREFLLKTALFPKVSVSAALELTGMDQAQDILEELTRRNYFTVRHAEKPEDTFEYHPLFRKFLQARLAQAFTDDQCRALLADSARCLRDAGNIGAAIELLIKAESWAAAAPLIAEQAQPLIEQGRGLTVAQWLAAFPQPAIQSQPWLGYWQGIAQLPFDPVGCRPALEAAYQTFRSKGDAAGRLLAWCAIIDSFIYEWGDLHSLDRWIEEVQEFATGCTSFPSPEIHARFAGAIFMALMNRQPENPKLQHWEKFVRALVLQGSDPRLRILIGPHLLLYYTWHQCDLPKAQTIYIALEPLMAGEQVPPYVFTTWCFMSAAFSWMMAESDRALTYVADGITCAEQSGVHVWDVFTYVEAVFATLSTGRIAEAQHYLDAMRPILDPSRYFDAMAYYHLSAWKALLMRNLEEAIENAEIAMQCIEKSGNKFAIVVQRVQLAKIRLYQGCTQEAIEQLRPAMDEARQIHSNSVIYISWLTDYEIQAAVDNESARLSALCNFLEVARQYNVRNHTGWMPEVMSRLYADALAHNIEPDYVLSMIRQRNLLPLDNAPVPDSWPFPVKLYTLGRFGLLIDDKPVQSSKKLQKKPIEMLKIIISLGGREINEEGITDLLWPEADGDAAHSAFTTTMQRLRKLLGNEDAILIKEGKLTLNPQYCYVDVWAFERLISGSDALWKENKQAEALKLYEKAVNTYKGRFLSKEKGQYMLSMQERLRSKFIRCLTRIGDYLEKKGEWEKAVECYQKGIEVDNLCEEFYQSLMLCCQHLGLKAEAITAYNRCCNAMTANLNTGPSAKTKEIYQRIAN